MEENGPDQFPLGRRPSIGPEATVNPFKSEDPPLTCWELLKTIALLPVLLFRALILVLALALAYVNVKCALVGVTDPLFKPFSRWRRTLLLGLRMAARVALFSFGYVWISVKGRPAPRHEAPIVVSNHISFIDPVFVFFSHMPVIVSARENAELPIVGVFLKALQIIPVDRTVPTSRKDAASQIRRRAIDNRWPHILIFPEGTTTNGKALISFKTGAFAPGLPVQPMVIRYPHKHINPAWVNRGVVGLMFRLMTQFVNFMEVEYLPVVEPTTKELRDPHLFAERVRRVMSNALRVPCTEHSFLDAKLAMAARRFHQPADNSLVEFSRMEKLFNIDYQTAEAYLAKFSEMDTTHSGVLHIDDFVRALDLPLTDSTRKVFELFDTFGKGYINFREFVAGVAFISKHTSFSCAIEAAFRACDLDNDGYLSAAEVEQAMLNAFPNMLKFQVGRLLDRLDLDHDGVISWDEFRRFLYANPEYLAVIMAAYPNLLKP